MVEDKPWMEFDQSLPKSFNDTTTFKKRKFIRLLPYTVYTRWNEDPVNDKFITSRTDTMTIRMKLDIEKIKPLPGMEHGYRVVPGGMDQSVTPSNNPIVGFDADKALFEIFTKRGRAIRRNRKKAKAWKIYKDYVEVNGKSAVWDFFYHNGGAAVVPVTKEGKILMVRQYRNAIDRETIEIPAGGLNTPVEPTIDAAARELEEETGIVVSELTEVGRIVDTSKHSAYVEYMCITDWDKDNIRLQEGETIAYKWVTRDELLAMKEDELVTERIQNFIEDLRL